MREVSVTALTGAIRDAVIRANTEMTPDIKRRLEAAQGEESGTVARAVIGDLLENAAIAATEHIPMCQDTGMVVVYLQFGQDVHWIDGEVEDAINEGIRQGYQTGYLRFSVVADPLRRVNTRDNTPAIVHYRPLSPDIRRGRPRGYSAEGLRSGEPQPTHDAQALRWPGRRRALHPGDSAHRRATSMPAIYRRRRHRWRLRAGRGVGQRGAVGAARYSEPRHSEPRRASRRDGGTQGFGGRTTLLGLRVKVGATHIAGLPVAVNMSCHSTRHLSFDL